MAKQLDRYRVELAASRKLERIAWTRLIRAQTIYAKHYRNSERLEGKIESIEIAIAKISNRLIGE